ncbi:hypothetical protein BOM_1039 (plasmid) [Borrelia miyamotoi FR64b]|uniref:Uncharacterized protein n=1 Tax=Borrelia miyamotoi FR64b TaxID=1292392 RepID=W5SF65_9SPIR|nr:hypothetical protein BOM_1039 [Borrelia miyamotoi FR64b]
MVPCFSKNIKTGILGFELIEEDIKKDNKKIYREFIRQDFFER